MTAAHPVVVAVVLTFRRTDPLRRCVDAIRAQTRPVDHLLVIDNDHMATDVLRDLDGVTVIETGENLGPAGGYALGMARALELGADKIWPIDDDCEPLPDCLELALAAPGGPGVVQPVQVSPGRRGHFPAFKGPIIDAEVVRAVGGPDPDIFFSTEDTEFFLRIRRGGFEVRRVEDAAVLHHDMHVRARGEARSWRLYYEVRNHLHYAFHVRKERRGVTKALKNIFGKLVRILAFEPHKLRSLRLWVRGVVDFARGRRGKVVAPERWPPG